MSARWWLPLVVVVGLCQPCAVRAQSASAVLMGRVISRAEGKPLDRAMVTYRHLATNLAGYVHTNTEGLYLSVYAGLNALVVARIRNFPYWVRLGVHTLRFPEGPTSSTM